MAKVFLFATPGLLLLLAYVCNDLGRMGPNQDVFYKTWDKLSNTSKSISHNRVAQGTLTDARRDAWYRTSVEKLTYNRYPSSECTVFDSTSPDNETWIDVMKEEKFSHPSFLGRLTNRLFRYISQHTNLEYTLASIVKLDDHSQGSVKDFFADAPEFMAATKELSVVPDTVAIPTWIGTFTACQSLAKTHANVLIGKHFDGPYVSAQPHRHMCGFKMARQMNSNFIFNALIYSGVFDDLYFDRVLCTMYLRVPPAPIPGFPDKSVVWVNGSMKVYEQGNGSYICYNSGRVQHTGGEGKIDPGTLAEEAATDLKMHTGASEPVKGCRMMWRWSAIVFRNQAERAQAEAEKGVSEAEILARTRKLLFSEHLLGNLGDLTDDQVWQLLGIRHMACAPNDFIIGYLNDWRFFGRHLCAPIVFTTKAYLYLEWYWRQLVGSI